MSCRLRLESFMRNNSDSVLLMEPNAAGAPVRSVSSAAWTLVDYLFPANHPPVWSGSVSDDHGMFLPKTA
jgi:hypothetical protein